jgi:integrase
LSEEEEAALLAVCSPALRRIVQVGLLTGFRRQELTSLRSVDVDLERGLVSVAACYAKNSESRTLPMGKEMRALFQEALAACRNAPVVFTKDNGEAWTPNAFAHAFSVACQRAGLEPLFPHVLRHTCASRLVMAGIDIRTVQELLGHKIINMTLRYAHLSPDHKRSAMEILEAKFCQKNVIPNRNPAVLTPALSNAKVVSLH